MKRQEIKKSLLDKALYNFEGSLDEFIDVLIKVRDEAKRENYNNVTVSFYNDYIDYPLVSDTELSYIDIKGSRLETDNEMKIRKNAEHVRKEEIKKINNDVYDCDCISCDGCVYDCDDCMGCMGCIVRDFNF